MKKKTNFDRYLDTQLEDPNFTARFQNSRDAWDVAVKIAELRKQAGFSQKALASKLGTSQQQISRLESPSYEGHSLSMLRRVAHALGSEIHVSFDQPAPLQKHIAESRAQYGKKK